MSARSFDKTFGADFISELPTGPGIYCFLDQNSEVIYVGKAKNLRRRLQNYRNATRKRVHKKMRTLVREAHAASWEALPTEEAALLRENELIRQLRPCFNVEGAFDFLYPALGWSSNERQALLCFTTAPEEYSGLDLGWYGCFRSRLRTQEAFSALLGLLEFLGHRENYKALPEHPRIVGSRLVGIRQIPQEIVGHLPSFLAGRRDALLGALARALLAKPRARRDAGEVQARLALLKDFYVRDVVQLRRALELAGRAGSFVRQEERDALIIRLTCSSEKAAADDAHKQRSISKASQ